MSPASSSGISDERATSPALAEEGGAAPPAARPRSRTVQPPRHAREAAREGKPRIKTLGLAPEEKPDARELRSTIRGVSSPPPALDAQPGTTTPPAARRTDAPLPPMSVKERAAASPPRPSAPPTSLTEEGRSEFQRLLDEVETGFDAILVTGDSKPPPANRAPAAVDPGARPAAGHDEATVTAENQFDQEQAKQLFQDLVVANAQTIRDFMIEVRLGEPHKDWIDHADPAARAILRSAEGMGLSELVAKVERFVTASEQARLAVGDGAVIRGEPREQLIDAYSNLIAFFPEAFAAEAESNKRESVIVRSLLSKVPGLYRLGVDRIYGTGLASLGLFYVSRPREIAELGGISLEVAERVVERFREYRRIASEMSPAKGRAEERARLRAAGQEMLRATRAYDQSAPLSAERRVNRRERQLAMADVSIYFARFGEVDRLRRIETMQFMARVEALETFLDESARRAAAEQRVR